MKIETMKKLALTTTILFTIALNNLSAQSTFTKVFGGANSDYGASVQQTNDGGYIIAGGTYRYSSGAWSTDVYLIKTNNSGDTLWTKTYGGVDTDYANSVQQTNDGGYIIAGTTYKNTLGAETYYDVYLIKTDSSGDALWTKTIGGYGDEYGSLAQQTSDGGYIITGSTTSFGAGFHDVYLIKTNGNGDTLWTKTFGGSNSDMGSSVQQTNDSGYIISGVTESNITEINDAYLIKTNSSGDTLWTKTFGGIDSDYANSVQLTNDGGFIMVGATEIGNTEIRDVYLIKTNSNGDALWTKTFGGTNDDIGNFVQQTNDGGYIIVGATENNIAQIQDVYLIKTNSSGDTLWSKTYGGMEIDNAYSVQQTSDGGYIIVGRTASFGAGSFDVYLIKTDSNGDVFTGIEEQTSSALTVQSYPNPATNHLNITTTLQGNDALQYQIINTLGATAMANKATAKDFSIDVCALPAGIYFIHLQSGTAQTVKRFVKE